MHATARTAHALVATLRRQRTPLLLFHLFFTGLAVTLLLPAGGWLMTLVMNRSGERAVSNRDVIDFVLSPVGALWVITGATLLLLLISLQRAGMIVIAAEHGGTPSRQVATALLHVARKLPRLLRLAFVRVLAHLVLAAPFLLAILALHAWLLGEYANPFTHAPTPAAFWWFVAAALPFALAIVLCNGALYARWLLALPAMMLEHASVRGALRRSHRLVSGRRRRLILQAFALATLALAMPAVLVIVFDNVAVGALGLLPDRFDVIVPATLALLALYIVFAFIVTFLGFGMGSVFLFHAYTDAAGRAREPLAARQPRRTSLWSWSAELLLVIVAVVQAANVLEHFELVDDVAVIAHRGSSIDAPENSLAAIERAIDDGADLLEIDVRVSADGVPVLLHDPDLRRIAGLARAVDTFSAAELTGIDIGARVGARYVGETVPTLDAALALARGRITPVLDLKGDDPRLVPAALDALREHGLLETSIIAASNPALLREAQRHAPHVRTALLIHFGIGRAASLGFDILGVRAGSVTPELVLAAQRRGLKVFVFTVNGRGEMSRFIDMGVDGIITDRPAQLAQLLHERAELSEGERLVVKLRHWLRE